MGSALLGGDAARSAFAAAAGEAGFGGDSGAATRGLATGDFGTFSGTFSFRSPGVSAAPSNFSSARGVNRRGEGAARGLLRAAARAEIGRAVSVCAGASAFGGTFGTFGGADQGRARMACISAAVNARYDDPLGNARSLASAYAANVSSSPVATFTSDATGAPIASLVCTTRSRSITSRAEASAETPRRLRWMMHEGLPIPARFTITDSDTAARAAVERSRRG